jgi:hypothetical protein
VAGSPDTLLAEAQGSASTAIAFVGDALSDSGILLAPKLATSADEEVWKSALASVQVALTMRTYCWNEKHPAALWTWRGALATTHDGTSGKSPYSGSRQKPSRTAFNDAQAVACLEARLAFFAQPTESFLPGTARAFGVCGLRAVESMNQALFAHGRESVLKRFNVAQRPATGYQGWDDVLSEWLTTSWYKGGASGVRSALGTQTPVVNAFLSHAALIAEVLKDIPNTAPAKSQVTSLLNRVATSWAMNFRSPNRAVVSEVALVAARVGVALPEESDSVLVHLINTPESPPKNLDILARLSPAFLKRLGDYRARLQSLGQGALAGERFGSFRARPVSESTLAAWETQAAAAAEFKAKESASVDASPTSSRQSAVEKILERSLKEGWGKNDYASLSTLGSLAQQKGQCEREASAIEALACVGLSKISRADGGILSPAFSGRYVRAVKAFREAGEFANEEFMIRNSLEDFWNPVWKSCANEAFESNLRKLVPLVVEAVKADFPRRFDAQRELQDLLDECR